MVFGRIPDSVPCEKKLAHNKVQRVHYSDIRRQQRITPTRSPVVMRHVYETCAALNLESGDRVLEFGCGMGRFSRLLAARGLNVTALDVSQDLVDAMCSQLNPDENRMIETVCCSAQEASLKVQGRFRSVVGFFFLHHLREIEEVFGEARDVLEPGGGIAFCEPNAFNPLYYLQVSLSPGMSWKVERGIPLMRSSVVFAAMRAAGFSECKEGAYGVLPPVLANTRFGMPFDRRLERMLPQKITTAYRVFSARLCS